MSFAPLTTLIIRLLSSDGEFESNNGTSSEERSGSVKVWNAFRLAAGAGTLLLTCSALLSASVTSPDWLLATHALLFGAGSSLLYLSSSLLISRYFPRSHSKHVLATSLQLAGYPLGVCWRLSYQMFWNKSDMFFYSYRESAFQPDKCSSYWYFGLAYDTSPYFHSSSDHRNLSS